MEGARTHRIWIKAYRRRLKAAPPSLRALHRKQPKTPGLLLRLFRLFRSGLILLVLIPLFVAGLTEKWHAHPAALSALPWLLLGAAWAGKLWVCALLHHSPRNLRFVFLPLPVARVLRGVALESLGALGYLSYLGLAISLCFLIPGGHTAPALVWALLFGAAVFISGLLLLRLPNPPRPLAWALGLGLPLLAVLRVALASGPAGLTQALDSAASLTPPGWVTQAHAARLGGNESSALFPAALLLPAAAAGLFQLRARLRQTRRALLTSVDAELDGDVPEHEPLPASPARPLWEGPLRSIYRWVPPEQRHFLSFLCMGRWEDGRRFRILTLCLALATSLLLVPRVQVQIAGLLLLLVLALLFTPVFGGNWNGLSCWYGLQGHDCLLGLYPVSIGGLRRTLTRINRTRMLLALPLWLLLGAAAVRLSVPVRLAFPCLIWIWLTLWTSQHVLAHLHLSQRGIRLVRGKFLRSLLLSVPLLVWMFLGLAALTLGVLASFGRAAPGTAALLFAGSWIAGEILIAAHTRILEGPHCDFHFRIPLSRFI